MIVSTQKREKDCPSLPSASASENVLHWCLLILGANNILIEPGLEAAPPEPASSKWDNYEWDVYFMQDSLQTHKSLKAHQFTYLWCDSVFLSWSLRPYILLCVCEEWCVCSIIPNYGGIQPITVWLPELVLIVLKSPVRKQDCNLTPGS